MAKDLSEQVETLLRNNANRESVLEQILHLLLEKFRSETGTIYRLDYENKTLFLISHASLPPQLLEAVKTISVGKEIAGQVVLQNKPVTICNLQPDTSGVAKPGAGGSLCVPLRDGDKIVGTIGIDTIRQHQYTPDETRVLEQIGRLIGRFLKL